MASFIKAMVVALVAVALVSAPPASAVIGCGTVIGSLSRCLTYATTPSIRYPSPECCNGVRTLNSMARTTPDRQAVCGCLKSLAGAYSGPAVAKAAGIPSACRVFVPYAISPNTNCARVQ